MSRGRLQRGGLIAAIALGARAASAAEADVTIRCAELSTEDAAEVEARVRANMLSAGLEPKTVQLTCEPSATQTEVAGNGRQVLVRTDRRETSVKEALLANADGALLAWGQPITLASAPASAIPVVPLPPPRPAAESARPLAVPALEPAQRVPAARPAVRFSAPRTWLSAGIRGELWRGGSALGPQLGLEHELDSAFLAVQVGYLVAVPRSARFSARELPLSVQLGWQPTGLLGIRGAVDVGLSFLSASPAAGVDAQNGSTNSTLPFLGVELSRPLALGQFALLPGLGVSAFSAARSVRVDQREVLAIPALVVQANLGLALKLGG